MGAGKITAAASGVAGLLGLIGGNKRQKKALERQFQADEKARESNYQYGEKAADAAHVRSLDLLAKETEANSLVSQVADAKEAGLNPGLLYGGAGGTGGSAGGGEQGGGARGVNPADIAAIAQVENEKRAIGLERQRVAAEAALAKAEAERTRAETKNIEEQTSTSETLTPIEAERIRNEIAESLQRQNRFDEKTSAEVAKLLAEASESEQNRELGKALERLNDAKTEGYWIELLNAIRETAIKGESLENERINALANQLAARAAYINAMTGKKAEEYPGGVWNTKTWTHLIDGAKNEIKELFGEGGKKTWEKYKKWQKDEWEKKKKAFK